MQMFSLPSTCGRFVYSVFSNINMHPEIVVFARSVDTGVAASLRFRISIDLEGTDPLAICCIHSPVPVAGWHESSNCEVLSLAPCWSETLMTDFGAELLSLFANSGFLPLCDRLAQVVVEYKV